MKAFISILFFFVFTLGFSQEICDNGIDDDNDGKIDLNDDECKCSSVAVQSIIGNQSFESFDDTWIAANSSRVDFINQNVNPMYPVEISKSTLIPFPDGIGIYGAIYTNNKKGYMGTCLISPMQAGEDYQLTLDIAALIIESEASLGGTGKPVTSSSTEKTSVLKVNDLEPIGITIYGTSDCANLPVTSDVYVNIYDAPPKYGPKWVEIGSATYKPEDKWNKLTITFTPATEIKAIAIGSPQNLPLSYPYAAFRGPYIAPYIMFDNLILNKSSLFGVNIARTGSFCENNLILRANATINLSANVKYQWYKNGIAILGETKPTLAISNNTQNFGNYIVRLLDYSNCIVSASYNVNNIIPEPTYTVIQPNCSTPTGQITITSPAKEYSFDNGATWGTNNVSPPLTSKTYTIVTRNIQNCEAKKRVTINDIVIFKPMYAQTPITYHQFDIAKPLTAGGNNLLWYTLATGGTGSPDAPIPSTATLGSTDYFVSQTLNECEDINRKKITVNIIPVPFSRDYPRFFTPNGDGHNDYWNITEFDPLNEAKIYIYDRYGKFLYLIQPNETGWDGTYSGTPLPADDYWFKAIYKENDKTAEFKSHFSLKR